MLPRVDVRVAVEVVVVVDVDVDVAVPPAPVAAPGERRSPHHPRAEHHQAVARRRRNVHGGVVIGWVVPRRAVHDHRRVGRDVDHLGALRLDHDDLVRLLGDHLLLGGLQVARLVGLAAHALDRVEQLGLLAEDGVAEIPRPVEVLVHAREHRREAAQRLHGGVPVLFLECLLEGLAGELGVRLDPAIRFDDLERIGRRPSGSASRARPDRARSARRSARAAPR